MPTYSLGPGIKYSIFWVMLVGTFLAGYYFGAKDQWGLATELKIREKDEATSLEIREARQRDTQRVNKRIEGLKNAKLHDCAGMRMSDILRQRDSARD